MNNQTNLLETVRLEIKRKNLSHKTENAYLKHIRRYLEFCADEDIFVERAAKISRFLEFLKPKSANSTRNQAYSALLFFYRDALCQTLSVRFEKIERAHRRIKKPEIFTDVEVHKILKNLRGASFLVTALMYGAGLRLPEALSLRVGDVDFAAKEIKVRDTNTGAIERRTMLPAALENHLRWQIKHAKYLYEDDCLEGFGVGILPENAKFYQPIAVNDLAQQYLFPAVKMTPMTGGKSFVRLHLAESTVQKAFAEAVQKASIGKSGGCQILRYSFASRLFEKNLGVHNISRLLGHKSTKTTVSYFDNSAQIIVSSPLD